MDNQKIEKLEWTDLIDKSNIIKLETYRLVICKHPDLEYLILMTWIHSHHVLSVINITNPAFISDNEYIINLMEYQYILLNPDLEGLQRLLKININSIKKEIELIPIKENDTYNGRMKLQIVNIY